MVNDPVLFGRRSNMAAGQCQEEKTLRWRSSAQPDARKKGPLPDPLFFLPVGLRRLMAHTLRNGHVIVNSYSGALSGGFS
jgi:hypothetical protein